MFCTNCGARQDGTAKFCTNCGASLDASVAVGHGEGVHRDEKPAYSSSPALNAMDEAPQKQRKSGKRIGRVVAALVVVAVALIGLGVAAFFTKGFGLLGVVPRDNLNDYTWEELSKISDELAACSTEEEMLETAASYHLVSEDGHLDGSQTKSVQLSDGTEAHVQIVGLCQDEKTDGDRAGITFGFAEAIGVREMNSSATTQGGWEQSEMRAWLNSDALDMLPEDLKTNIVAVNKLTNNTGATSNQEAVTVTSDSMWLFSQAEVAGTTDGSHPEYWAALDAEGQQYRLFSDAGASRGAVSLSMFRSLAGLQGGDPIDWWQRSPLPDTDAFMYSGADGSLLLGGSPDEQKGVVPGFCI